LLAAGLVPTGAWTQTVRKGVVILVEFPDVRHAVPRAHVQTRFNTHLRDYVREMSYGGFSLQFDVTTTWYTLKPIERYRISPRNLEVDRSRVRALIDDALAAADRDVDFTTYDLAVVFMGARITDYGMVGLCGYPGMLGWKASDSLKTPRGERVNGGVAIFTSQAHLGTLFHDVAHVLGGVEGNTRRVPCLYDHDLQARPGPLREVAEDATVNMGFWDPMSCHYYRRELPPPGISSWTRLRLNWMPPATVWRVARGERVEILLGPLADADAETHVIRIPVSDSAYYLVENRQPLGSDRNLPGSGVLIMYADDDVAECRRGRAPVKLVDARPSVPHLEGATFDAGEKNAFEDAARHVSIKVVEKTGRGYRILVDRR
jgi:M6 family metalloprotease-like protein